MARKLTRAKRRLAEELITTAHGDLTAQIRRMGALHYYLSPPIRQMEVPKRGRPPVMGWALSYGLNGPVLWHGATTHDHHYVSADEGDVFSWCHALQKGGRYLDGTRGGPLHDLYASKVDALRAARLRMQDEYADALLAMDAEIAKALREDL